MSDKPWVLIGAYLAFVATMISALVWYMRRLALVAPPPERAKIFVAGAEKRFKSLRGRFNLFTAMLWLMSWGLVYLVVRPLAQWRLACMPAAEMTVSALDTSMVLLVAMFAGMAISGSLFAYLLPVLWRSDGRFFLDCLSVEYGCDYGRLCRGLVVPFYVASAVLFVLGMNWYAQTRSSVLAIHPLFALGETDYHYSDIERIETGMVPAPPRNGGYAVDYWVVFRNGTVWDLRRELPSGGANTRRQFAEAIARHAGLTIQARLP